MGHKYTTLVWDADLDKTDKLILLAIADFHNDLGDGCWASYDRIAHKTGCSRRTVIYAIARFRKEGILVYQGTHKKGTNIWTFDASSFKKLPPYEQWLRESRNKEFDSNLDEGGAALAPHQENTPVQPLHPPSATDDTKGCNPRHEGGAALAPKLLVEPLRTLIEQTAVPAKVSAPIPSNGVHHDEDDEWSRRVPANERENIDDQITRGDDDLDDRAKMRPKTELEKKIVQLCKSSYITDNQRRRLSENVFAAQGKQRPQNYPSPESEWKENPDRFNAYVEDCARIQRNNTSRPPGRDALIGLIRNYARHKTGWLDFKEYKEVEAAPAKQAEGKYYENRPKRPIFGEKPRL